MFKEDHQFLNIMSQSAKLEHGHYSVCLPMRNKALYLPNNREIAEQCALNLWKRFSRDVRFYKEYVAYMDDVLKKGYVIKLNSAECKPFEGRT